MRLSEAVSVWIVMALSNARAKASYVTLEQSRREMIEVIAVDVGDQYETDADAGDEDVDTELRALVYVAPECYR